MAEHPETIALNLFETGYNCAQSVLAALAAQAGLEPTAAIKLASSFGGGIARRGQVCGAISGALMALGLAANGASVDDKEANYARAETFLQRFEQLHSTILCRDLTGCDFTTPAGRQQAAERDIHHTVCTLLVRDAVRIVMDMLSEQEAPPT